MKLVDFFQILVKGCANASYEARRFTKKKPLPAHKCFAILTISKQPLKYWCSRFLKLNFIKDLLKAVI